LILVLSVAVAYTVNIGHRLFARDATEDLPSRQVLFPVSTRRHFVPALSFRDFPGWSGFGLRQCCLSQPFRNLTPANLCTGQSSHWPIFALALSGGPFGRHAGHPLTQNRQHPSTHAPHAARGSPANPFLESPADSGTRAPNLQRLRQAG